MSVHAIAGRGIDFGLERVALERCETRWAAGLDEISLAKRVTLGNLRQTSSPRMKSTRLPARTQRHQAEYASRDLARGDAHHIGRAGCTDHSS
jgi:hypothetical protein